METSKHGVRWSSYLGLAMALLMLLPLGAPAFAKTTAADPVSREIEQMDLQSKARAKIVERVSPSVVNIMVVKHSAEGRENAPQGPDLFNDPFFRKFFQDRIPAPPRNFELRGLGSGIIVSEKGYVLTNNHVVAGADKITVKLPDGRQFDAKVVGTDPPSDVAVVKIDGKDLPVAKLGNSDDMAVGESVLAIGNPFGLEQTTTSGIVSAKGRNALGITDYENFIQTDASINPGNSGGPLLNLRGEVIGINTAIYGNSGGNMGIGFAIPINQAHAIMDELVANGKVVRGFLGVVIQEITPDLANAMHLKPHQGVLVSSVGYDTPAKLAGIQPGDVIVSFRNRPVQTPSELRNAVAGVKPGTTVPAQVMRDGKEVTINVKVVAQPKDMSTAARNGGAAPEGGSGSPDQDVLGMTLQPVTPEVSAKMGLSGSRGLIVINVADNGPAAEAGLQQGVEILEVNHHEVHTVTDVRSQVDRVQPKGYVLLLVRVQDANRFVALQKS